MILLIDNYDSFSYNLFQFVGTINPDIKVIRNDEMTVSEIEKLAPSHILISPGPGKPSDAGICEDVIKYFKGKIPILGVAGSNPVRRTIPSVLIGLEPIRTFFFCVHTASAAY
mgnify:CR=1 FL=1